MSVVVVGGGLGLLGAVRQTVETLTVANIATADVAGSANLVTELRPFAVVVSEDIYDFDSAEFDALARDVRTTLIVVRTGGISEVALKSALLPRITEAFSVYHR